MPEKRWKKTKSEAQAVFARLRKASYAVLQWVSSFEKAFSSDRGLFRCQRRRKNGTWAGIFSLSFIGSITFSHGFPMVFPTFPMVVLKFFPLFLRFCHVFLLWFYQRLSLRTLLPLPASSRIWCLSDQGQMAKSLKPHQLRPRDHRDRWGWVSGWVSGWVKRGKRTCFGLKSWIGWCLTNPTWRSVQWVQCFINVWGQEAWANRQICAITSSMLKSRLRWTTGIGQHEASATPAHANERYPPKNRMWPNKSSWPWVNRVWFSSLFFFYFSASSFEPHHESLRGDLDGVAQNLS